MRIIIIMLLLCQSSYGVSDSCEKLEQQVQDCKDQGTMDLMSCKLKNITFKENCYDYIRYGSQPQETKKSYKIQKPVNYNSGGIQ